MEITRNGATTTPGPPDWFTGTVLIDDDGRPTRETAPLWNDKRTMGLVREFESRHPPADYLARTEFLRDLSRRGGVGAMEEPFGFLPRAAYFGGLNQLQIVRALGVPA